MTLVMKWGKFIPREKTVLNIFPAEQYKINDPHCHIWPNDGEGKVRISLFVTGSKKAKIKGKVKDTDLTEIEKLVKDNEDFIHEEWKKEWIRE